MNIADTVKARSETEMSEGQKRLCVLAYRAATKMPKLHSETIAGMGGDWGEKCRGLSWRATNGISFTCAMVGSRGTGKTQMACEVIKEACKFLKPCLYTTAMEFFMDLKATFGGDGTESEVIYKYRKPYLLVIDEFGKRADSEWANNMMFELLDKRYGDKSSTIIIDNRTKKDFIDAVGPSLARRIDESGGFIVL